MRNFLCFVWLCAGVISARSQELLPTPFELSKGKQSATVDECFAFYARLQNKYPDRIHLLQQEGQLFPFVILRSLKPQKDPLILFINNAIHPGEPDGVDATMMLVRDICTARLVLPVNVELHIIPFYNVTGGRRRNSTSRVNQNGPEAYGFRANAQNLDLNRDFIKMDAKDTRWFRNVFHYNNSTPDIFIDTHVSNGADYQYTMTLLASQHDQLGAHTGAYQHDTLVPALYELMKQKQHFMCPYVNHFGETPDSGWTEFFDSPRYSSGYAAMFNTLSLVSETHMLKPFDKRVWATFDLLRSIMEFSASHAAEIKNCRARQLELEKNSSGCAIEWEPDTSAFSQLDFRGYAACYKPSEVSGHQRLFYDRNKPYEKKVKFHDHFKAKQFIELPDAYLLPVAYEALLNNLSGTGIIEGGHSYLLTRDTSIRVQVYTIESYKTVGKPYEGHYLHYQTQLSKSEKNVFIPAGSYLLIPMKGSPYRKFLANVLEPGATDSYFNWNFFDGILQQKEGHSDYVFEDLAVLILKQHPELQKELNDLKKADLAFAANGQAQLDWIYRHSPYFEGTVNEYPVFRIKAGK